MKLGDFLSTKNDVRELSPARRVSFVVVGEDRASGAKVRAHARAVLLFVDEAQRAEALRDAEKEMRQLYPSGALPPVALANEEFYQILVRALRDEENHRQPFADNVHQLKAALMKPVARRLSDEYEAFVAEEFPTHVPEELFKELVEDAKKKSLSALLTSIDFSTLAMALPGLAAHFGKSATETFSSGEPVE